METISMSAKERKRLEVFSRRAAASPSGWREAPGLSRASEAARRVGENHARQCLCHTAYPLTVGRMLPRVGGQAKRRLVSHHRIYLAYGRDLEA